MLKKRETLSATLLGRSALTIATGMPTSHDSTTEMAPISAVKGARRAIISATLSARKNEWPKLPLRMSRIQCRYWIASGSLSPSCAMYRARSAAVSLVNPSMPKIATSGSPGKTRSTTNTTIDTPTTVSAPNASRRTIYVYMARACRLPGLLPAKKLEAGLRPVKRFGADLIGRRRSIAIDGEPVGIRTRDLLIKSQLLYRLSYRLAGRPGRPGHPICAIWGRARSGKRAGSGPSQFSNSANSAIRPIHRRGEKAAGATSMFSCFSIMLGPPPDGGGQMPLARASSRMRKRSPASL